MRTQVMSNEHAPAEFRVISAVRNTDAWYDAFGAKPGDKYYLPPDQRVASVVIAMRRAATRRHVSSPGVSMKRSVAVLGAVLLSLGAAFAAGQPQVKPWGVDLSYLDKS